MLIVCQSDRSPIEPTESATNLSEENCPDTPIDTLIKKVEDLINEKDFLAALTTSEELEVRSRNTLCYSKRLTAIEHRASLLYNFGLKKGIVYEIDELLDEAFSILEQDKRLISKAKGIYYLEGIAAYGNRNYANGINNLQIAID